MNFNFVIESKKGKRTELVLFPSIAAAMLNCFFRSRENGKDSTAQCFSVVLLSTNGGVELWLGPYFQEFPYRHLRRSARI